MTETADEIVKVVELRATVDRVWRALTDYQEFGKWFRVRLDGPFVVGEVSTGNMTYPGYEHFPWRAVVDQIVPKSQFSFRWHDYDEKSATPSELQPMTRVEFHLESISTGTRLTITESGFASIQNPRRMEVMRNNREGWDIQAKNIADYVAA